MAEEIRRFCEALRRYRRRPFLYREPYWHGKFETMERIDEIIHIPNENDRYGEPNIFEEADADDRWLLHDAEHRERRQAIVEPLYHVWDLGTTIAVSQQQPASENLALGTPHNAFDANADAESSTARSRQQNGHRDVADRSKENNKGSQVFSNTNDASASQSDSSDDEDMNVGAEDAEHERILQLFEDFPTLIRKARHLPAIGSDDHGIMSISNPESGWSHIDPARLPPRVRKYLAEFTVLDAAGFPDGVYPDLALDGGGSRRWLLATGRKEFVCDTSTLDVWYRFLDQPPQSRSPQLPL